MPIIDQTGKEHLTNREIIQSFLSTVCRCGAKKWANTAFCYGCFDELSRETKKALYRKIGQGFETAYRQGCREIDGLAGRQTQANERTH